MTYSSKITAILAISGLCTVLGLAAAEKQNPGDYKIVLMNNCQIVSEQNMTSSQIEAYEALKEQEQLMHGLELPIQAIEAQMHDYSAKIEQLTALAIKETETSLHIDKTYMKQQEDLVDKLQQLVSSHQNDFDALELQGSQIGKVARVFEQAIKPSVADISYDQIQIIGPDTQALSHNCYSGISKR